MGVPGPVTSAPSEGVHELIRARDAALVTRGGDVLELVSPAGVHTQRPPPRAPGTAARTGSGSADRQVLDAVPVTVLVDADSIARTAGMAAAEVAASLARLASLGHVEGSGGRWRLAQRGGSVEPR